MHNRTVLDFPPPHAVRGRDEPWSARSPRSAQPGTRSLWAGQTFPLATPISAVRWAGVCEPAFLPFRRWKPGMRPK